MKGLRVCLPDYVAASVDADRRMKLGQKQRRYDRCGRWHWPNEKCEHPPLSKKK